MPSRRLLLSALTCLLVFAFVLVAFLHHGPATAARVDHPQDKVSDAPTDLHGPFYKPLDNITYPAIEDNFPVAFNARISADLPSIPYWNKPKHVTDNTPLFIGFTRNWRILQQAVVSYIAAGWPPEDIFVVDNTVGVACRQANHPVRANMTRAQCIPTSITVFRSKIHSTSTTTDSSTYSG